METPVAPPRCPVFSDILAHFRFCVSPNFKQIAPIVRSDNRKFFGLGPADKMDGYLADVRFTQFLIPRLPDAR